MPTLDGHEIELSNPDKILFPEDGITKGDVIDYYRNIADYLLPHIQDRPLTLQRFPDGLDEDGFYQQQAADYFPDWLSTHRLPRADTSDQSNKVNHILCNNTASLFYLANLGTLTLHRWLSRLPRYSRPDQLIFDLDPTGDDFDQVRNAALRIVELTEELEIHPYVMTTGSRGLHVVVPLKPKLDFDKVRDIAGTMAKVMADRYPETLTTEQRKNKRQGRIYLDIMRNAYGQTAVAPYVLRAKAGAPVATPLSLDELQDNDLGPQVYHIRNVFQRLGQKSDPWRDINTHAVDPELLQQRIENMSDKESAD